MQKSRAFRLNEDGEYDKASRLYREVLKTSPLDVQVINSLACLISKRRLNQQAITEASSLFKKAISLAPKDESIYYNAGMHQFEGGMIEGSAALLKEVINLDPAHKEGRLELVRLEALLHPTVARKYQIHDITAKLGLHSQVDDPRAFVFAAIISFIKRDYRATIVSLSSFSTLIDSKRFKSLDNISKLLCLAYFKYLHQILKQPVQKGSNYSEIIFHIGDSHSLTYATSQITLAGRNIRVYPLINIGAKAYAFSGELNNKYKGLAEENLNALPNGSRVLVSFGEIDCRDEGGLHTAASKLDTDIEEITEVTIDAYVRWFIQNNRENKHQLLFHNIPAPVVTEKRKKRNRIHKTVKLFNDVLQAVCEKYGATLIDLYKSTVDNDGWSNNIYHVDSVHLGPHASKVLEVELDKKLPQLTTPVALSPINRLNN